MSDRLRMLAVVHDADSGPALLRTVAEERGVEVIETTADDRLTTSIEGFDLLLDLGAAAGVNDDGVEHWLSRELALLRDADANDVPIFGVCFGAQALAVALGGSVSRASTPEIGWYTVDSSTTELIEPGPWFEWHFDAITPPSAAVVHATTKNCVQAYTLGRHLAVQFHPEVNEQTVADWAAFEPATLVRLGIDAAAMQRQTALEMPGAIERARRIFDRFLVHAGVSVIADASAP